MSGKPRRKVWSVSSRSMLLNKGRHLAMSGDILGCHNVVRGATGIWKVEAKDVANVLQCTGQPHPSQQRIIQPKMSIVPKVRNADL